MPRILDSLTELYHIDSYLRIVDFSKPFNSSKNIIDIRTDSITTAIRLPDSIPCLLAGTIYISDGVMHMLPGGYSDILKIFDPTTNRVDLTNMVWNFNIENQEWDIQVSGIEDNIQYTASAFDAEKQVGWYYGGGSLDDYSSGNFQDIGWTMSRGLYRLDKGKGAPTKLGGNSTTVWDVSGGELVYIKGVGREGILVLIGGMADMVNSPLVSIGGQNQQFLPFN